MTSMGRLHLSRVFLAAGLASLMVSCAGTKSHHGNGGEISKVKYYFLEQTRQNNLQGVEDRAITFEREHRLYGAISNQERLDREGNYYTIFWKVADRSQPVKVRFEYRQKGTGIAVKSQEKEIANPGRSNTTDFEVTASDFQTNGPVTCFKASLVRGKEVLDVSKSFMWERQ